MKNPRFTVSYTCDGQDYTIHAAQNTHYVIEHEITDSGIIARLLPRARMTLKRIDLTFDHDFAPEDHFFGNGYQAWTTTREYSRKDQMRGITKLAAPGFLHMLASTSGDARFVKTPKAPGEFYSHTYTYIKNRSELLLIGSLTERQGFTVIYADMNKNTLTISKDVEGVTVTEPYDLMTIAIERGSYDEVFDAYFKRMGLSEPRIRHMSGYTSWYNYFQKIDEKIILRDLDALDRAHDSVSIFQVDDGYETFVGDWLDHNGERFPLGMDYIAKKIHEKGYMAGIWMAPFSVQRTSRTYKEHPDWVIRDRRGLPMLGVVAWGGAYTLDIYNDEARAYIQSFFDVVLNQWNYDMVKLDFLYSQCMEPRNNKSRGTIMCEAMEFLRACCGDKLILGCGVPLGAAFGYVDACRISCDVDLKFAGKIYNKLHVNNEVPSARNAINNAIFRRHLNGRAFCNDPDVFFLRYSNLEFNTEQKLLLAGVNHIFGDVLFVSDNAEEYTDSDWAVLEKAFSESDLKILYADYISNDCILITLEDHGKQKTLHMDLATGESNIRDILHFER